MAILTAAASQFTAQGYDHLTMDRIAAEAHVGKQTIYRWWPSKAALIAECLAEGMLNPDWFVPGDSGDLRDGLATWVVNVADFLREQGNETLLLSLVIAAAENADVAAQLNERLGLFTILGERLGADAVEVGEAIVGAMVVRSLRRGTLDREFAERLVASIRL